MKTKTKLEDKKNSRGRRGRGLEADKREVGGV